MCVGDSTVAVLICSFTWYDWLHVEELSTVELHLHGLLVQHSYIIAKKGKHTHN